MCYRYTNPLSVWHGSYYTHFPEKVKNYFPKTANYFPAVSTWNDRFRFVGLLRGCTIQRLPCVRGGVAAGDGGVAYRCIQCYGVRCMIQRNPPVKCLKSAFANRLRAIRSRLWQPTGLPFTTATALRLPFAQGGRWYDAPIKHTDKSEFLIP